MVVKKAPKQVQKEADKKRDKRKGWTVKKYCFGILIVFLFVGVAHLIYREVEVKECAESVMFSWMDDCLSNGEGEDCLNFQKEEKIRIARKTFSCPFLFNCKC